MSNQVLPHRFIWSLMALGLLIGCQASSEPAGVVVSSEELSSLRQQYVANDEPDESLGVIELRESFPEDGEIEAPGAVADPADETAPVNPIDYDQIVVVGKVGGKCPEEMQASNFPIVQDEAVFYIVDPAFEIEAGHDHGEDHDCPFCNKKAVEAQAIVRIVGEDGRPLPVCVKALLDLEEDALVVVSGKAAVELDTLVITANKIYIRR